MTWGNGMTHGLPPSSNLGLCPIDHCSDLFRGQPCPNQTRGHTPEPCIAPAGNLCTDTGCWDADRCIVARRDGTGDA